MVNKTKEKKRNVGEIDEPEVIKTLVRYKLKEIEIPGIGLIKSVTDIYGNKLDLRINKNFIKKSPAHAKADVYINGEGYSIKSFRSAPPAIVNHSTREKWIRVANKLKLEINLLDTMVEEYWDLVINQGFGEDILSSNKNCPFTKDELRTQYFKKFVNYFCFKGTGTKDSKFPAKFLLDVNDPKDINTWTILDEEKAFDIMKNHLQISVRSKKGMPPKYPIMKDIQKKKIIDKWVRKYTDSFNGSLHVRIKKF